ncbi:hypothetical protein LTS18_002558 [Coniosporium uncinatum]|uniref:Uncharacterized protein n=1 Tax=Coniosporium uncinatum TaxID=93489 RepID=A0ACC3DYM4_9PEZI|nr:hypothetical protein LTS18_002558 [Coniosporium uncinatum]
MGSVGGVLAEPYNSLVQSAKNGWHLRPKFHILPPYGWINDPCAPSYDPATRLYHLFYQWNPKGSIWGNMSWGHSTSRDLIHWEYEGGIRPALKQDTDYDKDGVFTGCFHPTGPAGEDGKLTVFYTSVAHLPFHWTIPYPRNAAGLAVAVSEDGGKTWIKPECNPILRGEPQGVQVTGWRDPSLSAWEEMDRVRGEKSLYGVVNGGIKDCGPTSFLYAVKPDNLLDWRYLEPLLDLPRNFGPSKWWCGDWGVNLECTNFMSLAGTNSSRNFLITGAEGDREKDWVKSAPPVSDVPSRDVRWSLWMSGTPVMTDHGPQLKHDFGGILDHGIFYAASSLEDPVSQRRVVWGWLPEEDCPESHCVQRRFNGCLSVPRELFLQELSGVVDTLCTPLSEIPLINFANDRFALATRVYTSDQGATCISLFAEGDEEAALFEKVEVWEMGDIGLGKEVLDI